MAYTANNPNGSTSSANSSPVVIATDQTTIKTKLANDITATTGSITSATSTITASSLSGVGSASIVIYGTYAGVNATFEVSYDGTNWVAYAAQVAASATPSAGTTTGVMTSNSTNLFSLSPILGVQQVRVRATAWTSGSASVVISPSAQFTQYLVNVATMPAVTATLAAGTNAAGQVGLNPTISSVGLTIYNNQALTNTNSAVKASAARVHEYDFYNPNSSGVWVQMFNKLTANVTVGSTVADRTIYIPATSGRDWTSPYSAAWSIGLVIACTTTSAGGTAPTSAIQAYIGYI